VLCGSLTSVYGSLPRRPALTSRWHDETLPSFREITFCLILYEHFALPVLPRTPPAGICDSDCLPLFSYASPPGDCVLTMPACIAAGYLVRTSVTTVHGSAKTPVRLHFRTLRYFRYRRYTSVSALPGGLFRMGILPLYVLLCDPLDGGAAFSRLPSISSITEGVLLHWSTTYEPAFRRHSSSGYGGNVAELFIPRPTFSVYCRLGLGVVSV